MRKTKLLFEKNNDYLIIDFNNLFVASTITEELLIYSNCNDCDLQPEFINALKSFNGLIVDPDKSLNLYSGGERVIISFCIMLAAIKKYSIMNKKLLLNNSIESVSVGNRKIILELMKSLNETNNISYYELNNDRIVELCV